MFLYYGGFFTYKEDLNGYHGQDYMGIGQFAFLGVAVVAIVLLCIFLRKISHKKIDVLLKVLAIAIPVLEVTKIVVETVCDINHGHGFNYSGLMPLYTCSLFIYVLPIAAFAKGKVREIALSFLTTMSIFAGLTNFVMAAILQYYPFFNFHTFVSLHFHFWMTFLGVFLISTKYYVPKWKDALIGLIPLFVLSLIVVPVNYIFKFDYMFFYRGDGAPLLPDISKFFANIKILGISLRPIYTLFVYLIYMIINAIIVGIVRLICFIKHNTESKRSSVN